MMKTSPKYRISLPKTKIDGASITKMAAGRPKDKIKDFLVKEAIRLGKATAKRYGPKVAQEAFSMGEKIFSQAFEHTQNGQEKAVKYGAVIQSAAKGEITETLYKSKNRPSPVSKSLFAMARKTEYITRCAYQATTIGLSPTKSGVQVCTDMTTGCPTTIATADQPIIAAINTGSYTTYTSTTVGGTVSGALPTVAYGVTGTYASQSSASPQSFKVFFQNCEVETEISNRGIIPITIDLYELVAKHDTTEPAGITPGGNYQVLNGLNQFSPVTYWSYGLSQYGAAIGSEAKLAPSTIGCKPTDSALFNAYWKVAWKGVINLGPGDVHKHTSIYTLNKFIDATRMANAAVLQGITRTIMLVTRGTVVDAAGTGIGVDIGAATINVNHNIVYKAVGLPQSLVSTAYNEPYSTFVSGETIIPDNPQVGTT